MGAGVRWRSEQGTRTDDDRDFAAIGIRADEMLCIVLDGATMRPESGILAKRLGTELIDAYVTFDEPVDPERIVMWMRDLHADLSRAFPRASASYTAVLVQDQPRIHAIHAGDCLAGLRKPEASIEWVTQPHTLTNAFADRAILEIATDPDRHRLTRSFRSREFMRPDVSQCDGEGRLILATDGFWADLTADEQLNFLENVDPLQRAGRDDCSVLQITLMEDQRWEVADLGQPGTLYVRPLKA